MTLHEVVRQNLVTNQHLVGYVSRIQITPK